MFSLLLEPRNHGAMDLHARTTTIGTRTAVADTMTTARTLATVKPTVILFHRTTNQTSTLKLFASSNSWFRFARKRRARAR